MKKPRPIKIRKASPGSFVRLSIVTGPRPYMTVYTSEPGVVTLDRYAGWIEDRDVKRLLKWCERCLEGMKK